MSGTGKSTLIDNLSDRGYRAVDVDDAGWTKRTEDGEWIWQESEVERYLGATSPGPVFLSGCSESQVSFYPRFDLVILLSAPAGVITERLRTRTNNRYGKHPAEVAEVMENLRVIEPLLRRSADHEVDATQPIADVLARVLFLVGEGPDPG